MSVRVGINGFGRIGRNVLRAGLAKDADIEWVAVNDITDNATLGHLLKYDSILGPFPGSIEVRDDGLLVDGNEIKVLAERDPAQAAVEGPRRRRRARVDRLLHRSRDDAAKHLEAGAKKVVISAPGHRARTSRSSSASTTTSTTRPSTTSSPTRRARRTASRPLAKVAHETVGIKHGLMTTIHAYTADQRLQDAPHRDLRRARAAADQPRADVDRRGEGGRPRAARAQRQAPRLRGPRAGHHRLRRRPHLRGRARDDASTRSTRAFKAASQRDELKGILKYTEDPIVSTDIVSDPHSSIFDGGLTAVIDGTMVKVVTWYDNEWGYSNRCVDIVQKLL